MTEEQTLEETLESSDNEADYADTVYPDATVLLRPQKLPSRFIPLAVVVVAIAVFIAYMICSSVGDVVYFSQVRESEQITTNSTRAVSYDFPQLKTMMEQSDTQMSEYFANTYAVVQLATASDYPNGGFDFFKLPSDVTAEEGQTALASGISGMTAAQATKILNGGWRLTLDLSSYTDLRIRYTDFTSKNIDIAISKAMEYQGLTGSDTTVSEGGTDESGNTYKAGSVTVDDTTYYWRISAINFNDAYSINNMPSTAIYVGVRFTN